MKGILVGIGGRSRAWLETCREKNVELVGFVEPGKHNQERAVKEWGIPSDRLFEKLDHALDSVQADFLIDVTPPAVHEEIATTAFQAGLHVLGEKPLSDDLEAARRIVAAAKSTRRVHMITQNYRFGALPRTTRRLLDEGIIGPPEHVLVAFFMNWADAPGSHYVTQPFMLIKDMGVHHFDLLRYVLGREAVQVLAHSWNPSWGWHKGDACHTAIFIMSDNLITTHHALGCSKGERTTYNADWHVAGPEGSLTWERDQLFLTRGHKTTNPGREEIPLDSLPEAPLQCILTEFFSAIEEGRAPECNSQDNIRSLAMTFAVVKSIEEKRWVGLSEFGLD